MFDVAGCCCDEERGGGGEGGAEASTYIQLRED